MVLAVQKNTKNNSALQDLFYEASCPAMKAGAGDHKEQYYTLFFPSLLCFKKQDSTHMQIAAVCK